MKTTTIAALVLAPALLVGAHAFAMYHAAAAGGDGAPVVEVTLTEWRIDLSTHEVPAGRVVFRIRNTGRYPHAFEIERESDGFEVRSDTLTAGATAELVVDLPAGSYELEAYCPLPGHKERGMVTELEVTG